jgi:hypothetical protein
MTIQQLTRREALLLARVCFVAAAIVLLVAIAHGVLAPQDTGIVQAVATPKTWRAGPAADQFTTATDRERGGTR